MRTSYCVALLAVFVISTSVLPTSLMADEIVPTPSTLNLNVSAEIEKSPDVALINASVVTLDKTAQESMTQNAQKMSAVFIQLKTLGIAEKYMQTSGINLFPQYSSNQSNPTKITGYQASNSLTIKVHDMNKVGDVIDQLIKVGINQINGPSFTVDETDSALDAARVEAVQKAMNRANLYAKAANLHVKRIINISESEGESYAPVRMKTGSSTNQVDLSKFCIGAASR